MKKLIGSMTIILYSIFFSGCNAQLKLPKQDLEKTHYTQTNMWVRDSRTYGGTQNNRIVSKYSFYSVNYKYDKFIPINTPIKILKLKHNSVFIEIDKEIYAFNRTRQSRGKNLTQLFQRTFNTEKYNFKLHSDEIIKYLLLGKVKEGMTKDEVILARGYPPETKTKSLRNDTWYYWDEKRNKVRYDFNYNKLVRIDYY